MRKVQSLVLILFLLMIPVIASGSYSSFHYPNLPVFSEGKANGTFNLYVQKEGKWQEAGKLSYDRYLRQKALDLTKFMGKEETLKIKLIKQGGGNAHIDSVLLNGNPPLSISGIEANLKKLTKDDFDVVDASGGEIELQFSKSEGTAILSLTARIEEKEVSKTPFQYPLVNLYKDIGHNSQFYTYKIDGSGNKNDILIFKEYSITGSGHPSGYTYG
ncbi:MAG: hypothetical protein N3A59_06630, partial [Thermodesulfovibrionales bacterium]|nr:hypothetical protein [Thermodesulfovibrionales bacterium]